MRDDSTSKVLIDMLKENTGSHFLDSGGAYGRNHERNQGRSFEAEPYSRVEFNSWKAYKSDHNEVEVMLSLSTFHYLNEHLTYDAKMDRRLQTIINKSDRYTSYSEDIETFFDHLRAVSDRMGFDGRSNLLTGPEGSGDPVGDNSYNYESLLDQTIQYTYFDWDGDPYVVLQIHGGCDVRGGYTAPRVFSMDDSYALNFDRDASIYCNECNSAWDTDDGYNFEYQDYPLNRSEYNFKNLLPFKINEYDESESTFAESVIKRFGLAYYNRMADRIDGIRVAVRKVQIIPAHLTQRVINWAGKSIQDKSRAVLRVSTYGSVSRKRYVTHRWVYPVRSPRILAIARKVKDRLPVLGKLNLCKRYLIIHEDHSATCPVCGAGKLA